MEHERLFTLATLSIESQFFTGHSDAADTSPGQRARWAGTNDRSRAARVRRDPPGPWTFGAFALFIEPLPPGEHVLHAVSEVPAFGLSFEITYAITVTPGG